MFKFFIKILLLLISSSFVFCLNGCSAANINSQPESTDEHIVILHAGGGYGELTHLNAQETFEYYYNMGYRYFEYDLRLSSDSRIICTHAWENIDLSNISNPYNIMYEEFKSLRLDNGFTPANEEWLMETIISYPDVRFIIDAKMDTTEGDSAVLARLETLELIYNVDISQNIIPEIFSKEMWDIVKEQTSFERYLFSHYKVYYTANEMLEYFSDERIWGFALPTYTDNDIRSQIQKIKETKVILVFTPTSKEDVSNAMEMGGGRSIS